LANDALKIAAQGAGADKQFAKMFVAEVLKQSFANMSGFGLKENEQSLFPGFDPSLYSALLVDKLSEELIKSGSFKLEQLMPALQNTPAEVQGENWQQVISQSRQAWLKE
jgi:Rod binding domain-containing protein